MGSKLLSGMFADNMWERQFINLRQVGLNINLSPSRT